MSRPEWDGQEVAAWQRELPMRFNPPPGWPIPDRDWLMEYIGLPITADRRPPGAPASDPAGWEWWLPQDPQWSAWMYSKRRFYWTVTAGLGIASVASASIAVCVAPHGASLIAILCAIVAGVCVLVASVQYAQFRKDPMSPFREEYVRDHGG